MASLREALIKAIKCIVYLLFHSTKTQISTFNLRKIEFVIVLLLR